jgi:RNA polymerase sigma factor (sigma-70 family)
LNLESIYKEHKNLVYNLALNYTQNIEDAEEISQDVFVAVYENLEDFKADSKLSTWLYRITINKSLDFLKAKKAKKRFAFISSIFKDNTTELLHDKGHFNHPGVLLEEQESMQQIFACINELSPNQRTALILSKIDGQSQKEVAAIMDLNLKAVESLVTRAKQNLKEKLEKFEGK